MKYIATLGMGVLLASSAHAQVGVRAGLNGATLTTTSEDPARQASADGRQDYQVGVFYEQKLTKHLSVVPEVQFSRQSTDLLVEDYTVADGGYAARFRFDRSYLNVPVLLRATVGKFYLEAGPQVGYLLNAREKGVQSIGTIAGSRSEEIDREATDRYRRFDVGLSAGVGVKLPAGFGLGVRASTGLVSLTQEYDTAYTYGGDLKNQTLQASLSYQLKQ